MARSANLVFITIESFPKKFILSESATRVIDEVKKSRFVWGPSWWGHKPLRFYCVDYPRSIAPGPKNPKKPITYEENIIH